MITFFLSITVLILGYIFYSRFIERIEGIDQGRKTPAVFMTAVTSTYLLLAPEGFYLSGNISYPIGLLISVTSLAAFLKYRKNYSRLKIVPEHKN